MCDVYEATTLEGHHFVVKGWDTPDVMGDLHVIGMRRNQRAFQDQAKTRLVNAVIALAHFATTRRSNLPPGRHYHEKVDFTTELESSKIFAVDVGKRYTVFAYVSDVVYPPLSRPWPLRYRHGQQPQPRVPPDTVVYLTVTKVEAAARGDPAPVASSGPSDGPQGWHENKRRRRAPQW